MPYGTAPRRTSRGTWQTASGRKLTPAGAAYWEHLYQQGRTDGSGHIRAPEGPRLEPAPAESAYAEPSYFTKLRAQQGDPVAQRQVRIHALHEHAKRQGAAQARQLEQTAYDRYLTQLARSAYKTVNPRAGAVITALSPSTSLAGIYHDARSGTIGMAALETALLAGTLGTVRAPSPRLIAALRAGRGLAAVGQLHMAKSGQGPVSTGWLYGWPW